MNIDWTYISALVFAGAFVAYFMFSFRRKLNNQRLAQAVETCIDAIYRHIYTGLKDAEGHERATRLAGCAVNELFGFETENQAAQKFMAENKGRIQALVADMVKDSEIRPLAGSTVIFISSPQMAKKMRPHGGLLRAGNLGLVDPTEKPMPVSRYLAETAKFHRKAVKASEN